MVTALTSGVMISISCKYEPRFSNPGNSLFMFSYHINIENHNAFPIKLERRKWEIRDSSSHKREVEGEGVVGQQPLILPGENYTYRSSCDFSSDTGQMFGSYQMRNLENQTLFDVPIPPFMLMVPHKLN
jgi:ApaG protein